MKDWYVYSQNHVLIGVYASRSEAVAWCRREIQNWLRTVGFAGRYLVHYNRSNNPEGEWIA